MPKKPSVVPKYQLCANCNWKGEVGKIASKCPNCIGGFLMLKSTRHKSSPTHRSKKARSYYEDGFRLHRDPKGKGWSFVEGKKLRGIPQILSNGDVAKINACVARRGLNRSARTAMGFGEKEIGK